MVRAIQSFPKLTLLLLSFLALSLGACSAIIAVGTQGTSGIARQDLADLRNGKLLDVRTRYEDRQKTDQPELKLNDREQALLCDIYVKHVSISEARDCLDKLEKTASGAKSADSINGKRALIHYLLGEYDQAAARSKDLTSDGGRYVYALARVKQGDNQPALKAARGWELSYQPPLVYLAANLYLATERYDKVLETLQDPERRLDRDYNLSGSTDIFGNHIDPAPLRVDLFGEFGFGLLDTYSYAPRSNIYVEYTLAKAELETGQIDKARKRYDTILAFPWIDAYRDVQWRALSDRARVSEFDGETDRAIELYKQSVEVIERARESISTDAGRIGFVGDKQEVYGHLVRLLLDRGDVVAAFEYSERARSRALVDLLASVREFGAQSVSQQERDTATIRSYEQTAIKQSEGQDVPDPKEIESQTRSITEEGRRVLYQTTRQVSVLVRVPPTKLIELQPLLQENEALLSYYHSGKQWVLFLLTRFGEIRYVELEAKELEANVSNFRRALDSGGNYDEDLAKRLYIQLIQPLEKELPEQLTLTIVPHGVLHHLPFAALKSPDNKYLIQKHTLRMLPSADLRRFITPKPFSVSSRMLAIGNPTREGEPDLPGAEQEAVMASKMARTRTDPILLLRDQATKKTFMSTAPSHEVIHIASHGEFVSDEPLESRLLLAPRADGDLKAKDLFRVGNPEWPQWGAQLVILSACQSTLGMVNPGQDIIGLQRGFFFAGTDSIIGTLWRISDRATFDLMTRFYTYLYQGASGATALRRAQEDFIKNNRHPKDWAAFTFTGLTLESDKAPRQTAPRKVPISREDKPSPVAKLAGTSK